MGSETIEHPAHYNQCEPAYEVKKIIRAHGLNFTLGNVVKYVLRAPHKGGIEDLKKAAFYINDEIEHLEGLQVAAPVEPDHSGIVPYRFTVGDKVMYKIRQGERFVWKYGEVMGWNDSFENYIIAMESYQNGEGYRAETVSTLLLHRSHTVGLPTGGV